MHLTNDPCQRRKGYIYRKVSGGYVGYPDTARPSINWKHIDGPLLYYRDGQLHWLTLWERFLCWIGKATAESIERERRPELLPF